MSRSRILLYVFYDRDGIIDDYVVYQLQQMRTQVDKIVMICQGGVREDQKDKADSLADQVICRENKGYDAGAWRDGMLNHVGWDEIEKYDDLILMNDSCYGPIFPISEMFEEMDDRNIDFWGVTKGGKQKDSYKLNPYGYFPEHIQSYFTCYKKSVHTSLIFREYWEGLTDTNSFKKSVSYFETVITKLLEENNFKWEVYIETEDEIEKSGKNYNPTLHYADILLREKRNPLLKKKTMMGYMRASMGLSSGKITKTCMDYIKNETNYDDGLIYKNIIRLGNIKTLYELYNLRYLFNEERNRNVNIDAKTAVVMSFENNDNLLFARKYFGNLLSITKLFIYVCDDEGVKITKDIIKDYGIENAEIHIMANKRVPVICDEAKDLFGNKFDYVGFIQDRLPIKTNHERADRELLENALDSVLGSEDRINRNLELLETNRFLGIIAPPFPLIGQYVPQLSDSWWESIDVSREILTEIGGKNLPIKKKDPILLGNAFWCKSDALRNILDYDWEQVKNITYSLETTNFEFHPVEKMYEYLAQVEGYYTGTITSIEDLTWRCSCEELLWGNSKRANKKYKKQVESKSYKIGYTITTVPRKIRSLVSK